MIEVGGAMRFCQQFEDSLELGGRFTLLYKVIGKIMQVCYAQHHEDQAFPN